MGDRLQLGDLKPMDAIPKCGFGLNEPLCEAVAVYHIWWLDSEPESTSFSCEEHMSYIRHKTNPRDDHEIGPDCGKDGSYWKFSDDVRQGWCYMPGDTNVETHVEVLELTGAGV